MSNVATTFFRRVASGRMPGDHPSWSNGDQATAPLATRRSISSRSNPNSPSTSRVCSPTPGSGRVPSPGVRDRRGAGAGSRLPCVIGDEETRGHGCAGARAPRPGRGPGRRRRRCRRRSRTTRRASCCAKMSANRAAVAAHDDWSIWCGMASASSPRPCEQRGVELRLDRTDRHELPVLGAIGVVERRAGVEHVGAALVAPHAGVAELVDEGGEVRGAVDHRGVDHLAACRSGRARAAPGTMPSAHSMPPPAKSPSRLTGGSGFSPLRPSSDSAPEMAM